jgi:transposase
MAQYTINSTHASVIALDTHARTITAKGINLATGETKKKRFNDCPTPADIAAWITSSFPGPWRCAYESGCTGFYLCRELIGLGINCDVVAVSTVARSVQDKQNKNDRMDARRLLAELLNPVSGLSVVWLPDTECEGVRDLLRCYQDASLALRRARQQTTALLLRHGYVFNEKTPTGKAKKNWGAAFMKWLNTVDLGSPYANAALAHYRLTVAEYGALVERLKSHIDAIATEARWKPCADALCLIGGIDTYSALVYAAEIGDFSRFKNGRSISKWTGITPKNHASGEKKTATGHITKAGSAPVRTALIEGCSSMGRRTYRSVAASGKQTVSTRAITECNRCNRRLIDRFRHLTEEEKKPVNVAKVAVASEMIRWVWAIGLLVQEEQLAKTAVV